MPDGLPNHQGREGHEEKDRIMKSLLDLVFFVVKRFAKIIVT
jgi:hypothetical protein